MKRSQGGFTMVEITVTVVIAAIFIALLTEAYTYVTYRQQSTERYAKMSNIAQANLNKYQTVDSLVSATGASYPANNYHCTQYRSPSSAFVLLDNSSPNKESIPKGNYGNVVQKVVAYSPHYMTIAPGLCSDVGFTPTIVSTVEFGQPSNRETVTYSAKVRR